MLEVEIKKQIQVSLVAEGARLFVNNVGVLADERGVPVRFGLCPGSSDLIGWMPDGRFLAVEVKRPGEHPTQKQSDFIAAVRLAGGVGFVAHSAAEASQEYRANLRSS